MALNWTIMNILLALLLLGTVGYGQGNGESLSEQQYRKALELRSKDGASVKQLAQAASLLKAAAGLRVFEPNSSPSENTLLPESDYIEITPGVQIAINSHAKALVLLSKIYLQEQQGLVRNPRISWALIKHAASMGNPEAHRELGLAYAIGLHAPSDAKPHKSLFELGEQNIQKALLHLFFAANGNDSLAQLALGFRHSLGLGVPKQCMTAAMYYDAAAQKVVELTRNRYKFPKVDKIPLSVYQGHLGQVSRDHERLHYKMFADLGYVEAQRTVGKLFSQGTRPEDVEQAVEYFRKAAASGDGDAQAHLGHHYANGLGVEANNETAVKWFRLGAERGSASAQFGLGFMYLYGYSMPKNYTIARNFMNRAAEKGHGEAFFHLGIMHMNGWGVPTSTMQAQNYFALAAKVGHLLAQYNLAMTLLENEETCELGVDRLKNVAERGPWASMLQEAADNFAEKRYESALMGYLKGSEAGYELAQVNAGWMIGNNYGIPSTGTESLSPGSPTTAAAAGIRANQRASQQGNVAAMLAVGDTHYYGRGVARDWSTAFQLYSNAARAGRSAQGYFNMGYMHQYGIGVESDSALAKRNYDKAGEILPAAMIPARLAILSLQFQVWWKQMTGGLPGWLTQSITPSSGLSAVNYINRPAGSFLPKPSFNFGVLENYLDFTYWDPQGIWNANYDVWEAFAVGVLSVALAVVLYQRRRVQRPVRTPPIAPASQENHPQNDPSNGPNPPSQASSAGNVTDQAEPLGGPPNQERVASDQGPSNVAARNESADLSSDSQRNLGEGSSSQSQVQSQLDELSNTRQ